MTPRILHGMPLEDVQRNIAHQPDVDAVVDATNIEIRIGGRRATSFRPLSKRQRGKYGI